MFNLSWC